MSGVRLDGVSRRYGGGPHGVIDFSCSIANGECFALLGPSGCGKTTTLRIIAGLESLDTGRVWFDDRDVTELPPEARNAAMVFQSYALFPHLDVYENVAFGLRARRFAKAEIPGRVDEALGYVQMQGLERRPIAQLSGGQQQRIALARALAIHPDILLLDEPLSNLDAELRYATRAQIAALQKRLGITAVYVTHDQEEALDLADRIAVIKDGHCHQIGTPDEILRHPATEFVAGFLERQRQARSL